MTGRIVCLVLLSSCIQFIVVGASSFNDDVTIRLDEADVIEEFRELVRPKLPHKYMEESIFLVKWLRARNFDVKAAEKMLLNHIQWRAENKMDTIDEEDWEDFKRDFPLNLAGVDKEGRPMVQIILKDWDISKAMADGQGDRLTRWVYKYFEDATKLVRKFQSEGKNVTRFTNLVDAEGFNVASHGCPKCMSTYLAISHAYEEQYPGALNKSFVVNTPQFYRFVIRLIWPILTEETRRAMMIYGPDRENWREKLAKIMDDDQLLPQFGGTMKAE